MNYTKEEFFAVVVPLIEKEIDQFKKANNCEGCIPMWLGYDQNLNLYRVSQDHVEALSHELNNAGWINHNVCIQTDERTGEDNLYINLYL